MPDLVDCATVIGHSDVAEAKSNQVGFFIGKLPRGREPPSPYHRGRSHFIVVINISFDVVPNKCQR